MTPEDFLSRRLDLNRGPIPSFRGILPQLETGVIILTEQQEPSGLWSGDAWLTSEALQALVAYHDGVQPSEFLGRIIEKAALALAGKVLGLGQEVEKAEDLAPGLPDRLRAICAAYSTLQLRTEQPVKEALTRAQPALLKLLDSGIDYAKDFGDLTVADEVLGAISVLNSPGDEASAHAEPWLVFVTRALLNPDRSIPDYESRQVSALTILLRTEGTTLEGIAKKVWAAEAPRMTRGAKKEVFEKDLPGLADELLGRYRPTGLADMCLAIEARRVKGSEKDGGPESMEKLAESLMNTLIGFRDLAPGARTQLMGPVAEGVRLLSTSDFARVSVYATKDEESIAEAVARLGRVRQGKLLEVSKTRLTVLELLTHSLAWVSAFIVYRYDPGTAIIAFVLAGIFSILLEAALRIRP